MWAVEQLITGGGGQDRTWGVGEFIRRTMGLTDADLDTEALKQLAAAHLVCVWVCVELGSARHTVYLYSLSIDQEEEAAAALAKAGKGEADQKAEPAELDLRALPTFRALDDGER